MDVTSASKSIRLGADAALYVVLWRRESGEVAIELAVAYEPPSAWFVVIIVVDWELD